MDSLRLLYTFVTENFSGTENIEGGITYFNVRNFYKGEAFPLTIPKLTFVQAWVTDHQQHTVLIKVLKNQANLPAEIKISVPPSPPGHKILIVNGGLPEFIFLEAGFLTFGTYVDEKFWASYPLIVDIKPNPQTPPPQQTQ